MSGGLRGRLSEFRTSDAALLKCSARQTPNVLNLLIVDKSFFKIAHFKDFGVSAGSVRDERTQPTAGAVGICQGREKSLGGAAHG